MESELAIGKDQNTPVPTSQRLTDETLSLLDLVRLGAIKPERRDEIEYRTERCVARLRSLLRDEVLVRLRPRVRKAGSVWLHHEGKERNLWGDVLAVGPGRWEQLRFGDVLKWKLIPTEVRPGDLVRLVSLRLTFLEDFGDDGAILLVSEEYVAGVLEEESDAAPQASLHIPDASAR